MLTRGTHVSKLRERRRRRRFLYLYVYGAVLLLICGALVGLSYLPQLTIGTIEVRGASTIPQEEIRGAVETVLSEKYFYVLPKRNIFLYPHRDVSAALLTSFPKLRAADTEAEDLARISVTVEERSPSALWCVGDVELRGPCYFLDKDGFVYAPAPEFSGTVFVRYRGNVDGGPIGTQYLSAHEFRSLSALVAELGATGEPSDVAVKDGDAEVLFIEGFSLFFALKDKPEGVLERLGLALKAEPLAGKDLSTLSYVDLRFGDRVVYKFK